MSAAEWVCGQAGCTAPRAHVVRPSPAYSGAGAIPAGREPERCGSTPCPRARSWAALTTHSSRDPTVRAPPTLRRCSSSSCMRSCSLRTITCRFHSGMGRPCSSWLGTRASTSGGATAPGPGTGELPLSTGSGEPPAMQRGGPPASGVAGGVGVLVGDGEDAGESACGGKEERGCLLCPHPTPHVLGHPQHIPLPPATYVGPCLATAREDSGEAFALRCRLQALPSLDFSQELRVVASGGHHVERLGAWWRKAVDSEGPAAAGPCPCPCGLWGPEACRTPSDQHPAPSSLSTACKHSPMALCCSAATARTVRLPAAAQARQDSPVLPYSPPQCPSSLGPASHPTSTHRPCQPCVRP